MDQIISFSGAPDILSEPDQTTLNATFTFSEPTQGTVGIDLIFSGGDAVPNSDFIVDLAASENIPFFMFVAGGTRAILNIPGGVTSATLAIVPLIDDDADTEIIDIVLLDPLGLDRGFDLDPDANNRHHCYHRR